VISFGSLGQGGGGAIAGSSARLGIATAARGAIAAGTIARAGGGAVLEPCALLGRRDIQCVADGNGAKAVWIADLLPNEAAPAIGAMIDQGMGAMKKTLERTA